MREILFKAKRIDNGDWVEGNYAVARDRKGLRQHNILVADNDLGYFKWHVINSNTLCQYTGLSDKNGNKIWENDVVKDNVVFGNVVWDSEYAQFIINDEFDGKQDYSDWWQEVEVIGNIFDNPELLEGGVDHD